MRIFIGADHAGFEAKEFIKQKLHKDINKNIEIIDVGTNSSNSCDYPDIAKKVIKALKSYLPFKKTSVQNNFGILICGTGIGMCMVANRYKKIRAVVCNDVATATISRKHNNANVLCLGARTTDKLQMLKIIDAFLTADYEAGRHNHRIAKF